MPENEENSQSPPQPEDAAGAEDAEGAEGGAQSAPGRDWLQLIWTYHPLALLALALVIAGVAYSILPAQVKEEPKPLSYFYDSSLTALRKVKNPLIDAGEEDVQHDVQEAKSGLDFVFRQQEYRRKLEQDPTLINPYLLFGESLYIYGNHPGITQERAKTFQQAYWAFSEALKWEDKRWSERDQRLYDQQFFRAGEPFDERTLAARKLLRRQYEQYMCALAALKAEQFTIAAEYMDKLLQDFRTENLGAQADDPLRQLLPTLAPHEFEILPEDRIMLYFHLGQLSEKRGDQKEAERYYQIFLLHAKRSREFFIAMMRLGSFYFDEAGRNEAADPQKARRLYQEAADIFTRVVAASPPGDLLREAYFTGGRAFLNIARLMPAGEMTIWNSADGIGQRLEERLSAFSRGNALPERTRAVVPALGRLLTQAGLAAPLPPTGLAGVLPGQALSLAMRPRMTPRSERAAMLRRAKAFFTGSQGGEEQRYDGASYVMLSRAYMAEGDYEKARGLLRSTSYKAWGRAVELACQYDIAVSYQLQGLLDRALVRFIGGVEKQQPSLLVEYDVKSWTTLCRSIFNGSREEKPGPGKRIWGMLPDNVQQIIRDASITDRLPERFQPVVVRSLNNLISREDFYDPKSFAKVDLPRAGQILLQSDITLLPLQDRQWLNRMLLDRSLRESLIDTESGEDIRPFPSAAEIEALQSPVLLNPGMITQTLGELARSYTDLAARQETQAQAAFADKAERSEEDLRLLAAAPRRSLLQATQVNQFLIADYQPANRGEVMFENAGLLKRRSYLAAMPPFRDIAQAQDLIAQAAEAYIKIGFSGEYPALEAGALQEAGANFYAAGKYGRSAEALARYAAIYHKLGEIGWARNLLGRCYWLQGRYRDAITVYRENSVRSSPDGRDSMYYLGAVFLDARELPGATGTIELLGDPKAPYAREDAVGQFVPQTALQVFNEIRRNPNVEPPSRPWRWATFALGKTWYEIARRTQAGEVARAEAAGEQPAPIVWLPHYETAIAVLREALERYRLKYSPEDTIGISLQREPEDYYDVMRQRMETEYFLAMALRVLAKENPDRGEEEMRQRLTDVIDLDLYPKSMADTDSTRLLLGNRSVLGITFGPLVRPRYLDELRYNAFFFLAQSWKDLGNRLAAQNKQQAAAEAREKALQVYRTARDRLGLIDGPRILYNMGELMVSLNRPDEARRIFLMVTSQVNQLEGSGQPQDILDDLRIWRTLAQDRIKDLDNRIEK